MTRRGGVSGHEEPHLTVGSEANKSKPPARRTGGLLLEPGSSAFVAQLSEEASLLEVSTPPGASEGGLA